MAGFTGRLFDVDLLLDAAGFAFAGGVGFFFVSIFLASAFLGAGLAASLGKGFAAGFCVDFVAGLSAGFEAILAGAGLTGTFAVSFSLLGFAATSFFVVGLGVSGFTKSLTGAALVALAAGSAFFGAAASTGFGGFAGDFASERLATASVVGPDLVLPFTSGFAAGFGVAFGGGGGGGEAFGLVVKPRSLKTAATTGCL